MPECYQDEYKPSKVRLHRFWFFFLIGRVARAWKSFCLWNEDRGENIAAARLGKILSGGGCPRFVVGTWSWG
jgi:hypothetical protein